MGGGLRLMQVVPVGSGKYEDLMTKVERGEVDVASYNMRRIGGVNKAITSRHLLEQSELGSGGADLRNKIHAILSNSTNVHLRMRAMLEAIEEVMPATAVGRLRLTAMHSWIRGGASGGSVDKLLNNTRS